MMALMGLSHVPSASPPTRLGGDAKSRPAKPQPPVKLAAKPARIQGMLSARHTRGHRARRALHPRYFEACMLCLTAWHSTDINSRSLASVFSFLSRDELESAARVCRLWAAPARYELQVRSKLDDRRAKEAIRLAEQREVAKKELRAFYSARSEDIKANKDRNRKCEKDRATRVELSKDRSRGRIASMSAATARIPAKTLQSAPPQRMQQLLQALSARGGGGGGEAKAGRNPAQGSSSDDEEEALRLVNRLIGASIRDEDYLEAHRLKGMRNQLIGLRERIVVATQREDFMAAHKASEELKAFLVGFRERAIGDT